MIQRGLCLLCLMAAACPAGTGLRARPVGGLQIDCQPKDAQVYVDDRYVGTVAGLQARPLALPVGAHRIELRREGHFAHYSEVTIAKGVRQRIEIRLRKEPF